MLSRQEVNTMRHLANAQYWDRPAGGNTGRLFLAFGGPVCADRISNCPLDRVLTYKNLIYLLNLQFYGVLFFMPHGWSLHTEEFSEEVSGRIFDPLILSMKQGGTASKTCEKHGPSAMHQLSLSLLNFPI